MTQRFDLRKLTASPAAINFAKLDHFNGTHIRNLPDAELARRVRPYFEKAKLPVTDDVMMSVAPLIKERLTTLDEAPTMAGFFFRPEVTPQREELMPKGMDAGAATGILKESILILEGLQSVAPRQRNRAPVAVDRTARPWARSLACCEWRSRAEDQPTAFPEHGDHRSDTVLRRLRTAADAGEAGLIHRKRIT
jgi:hypothetical protein